MAKDTPTKRIEIVVDGPNNEDLYFSPAQYKVRGEFDVRRIQEPNAGRLFTFWPEAIPGQRIVLEGEVGHIVEPLHSEKNMLIRERVEATGRSIPKERTSFDAHVPTWLYWMKRAVESGVAKLVSGKLPREIEGEPRRRFHSVASPDPMDRMVEALELQAIEQKRSNDLMFQLLKSREN